VRPARSCHAHHQPQAFSSNRATPNQSPRLPRKVCTGTSLRGGPAGAQRPLGKMSPPVIFSMPARADRRKRNGYLRFRQWGGGRRRQRMGCLRAIVFSPRYRARQTAARFVLNGVVPSVACLPLPPRRRTDFGATCAARFEGGVTWRRSPNRRREWHAGRSWSRPVASISELLTRMGLHIQQFPCKMCDPSPPASAWAPRPPPHCLNRRRGM
jgi:hypothetical protein